jgi:hypothetical protein
LFLVTVGKWFATWTESQLALDSGWKVSSITIWKDTQWSMKFIFKWLWEATEPLAQWADQALGAWKGLIWQLILQIMWLVIIWIWLI